MPLRRTALAVLLAALWTIAAVRAADFTRNDRRFFWSIAEEAWPESGLAIYVANPELQIGPAVILLMVVGDVIAGADFLIGLLTIAMLTWPAIALIASRAGSRSGAPMLDWSTHSLIAVGAFTWVDLCVWAHIDDVLATLLLLAALHAYGRAASSGLLVGLAAACKPWAVVGLAMAPTSRVLAFIGVAGLAGAVFVLPFVLSDSQTVTSAGSYAGQVFRGSAWRLVGLEVGDRPPPGLRLAELTALALLALWLGRRVGAARAIVAVLSVRVLLEPGTHSYYVAPIVVMLLASGLSARRQFLAAAASLILWLASNTEADLPVSFVRVGACVALVLVALGGRTFPTGPSPRNGFSESDSHRGVGGQRRHRGRSA